MRIQKREGWVALAYWIREEWVGGRRWSGHSRPVIPSVIPPGATRPDRSALAGRATRPELPGQHSPACRGRSAPVLYPVRVSGWPHITRAGPGGATAAAD